MKLHDLNKLLENDDLLNQKINEFLEKKILKKQVITQEELQGHMEKASHNLNFIKDSIKLNYLDWAITGCYYATYHAALALILTKGYYSKNHVATLCILIKEFYKKELAKEDLELLAKFLDYQDVLFYVESKNKREDTTYSTQRTFDGKEVEQLRIKAVLFVNKIEQILKNIPKQT